MNPPCAGIAVSGTCAGVEENGETRSGAGSDQGDFGGASREAGAGPGCENMRVKAPGSELAGGFACTSGGAGSRAPAACVSKNVRVNSPGPDEAVVVGGGTDASATSIAGSAPGLALIELNICVKLPGEEGAGALATPVVSGDAPEPGERLADGSA
ncbi:MAG: hypothetical protein P4K78_00720 [Terracidiphilus sp.]|nr:hypothetical protein [Terracidiphilus sp.]